MGFYLGLMAMEYSEETRNKVDVYIDKLVESQPRWIRRLFESEALYFIIDEDGALQMLSDKSICKKRLGKISAKISKYLDANPVDFLQKILLH